MRRRRSCRCRFVRCRTGRARRAPAGWPGIGSAWVPHSLLRRARQGWGGKSKVGETGQVGNGLSVSVCQQCVRVNALRDRETTRAIRLSRCPQGIKTGPLPPCRWFAHAGPITWLNRSTNTARLICWRNWRNQVPATFSAARGRAGRRGFLSRCPSAKITRPTRAAVGTVSWARVPAEVHDRRGGLSASPFCPWPAQVRPCHGDTKMTNEQGSWICQEEASRSLLSSSWPASSYWA